MSDKYYFSMYSFDTDEAEMSHQKMVTVVPVGMVLKMGRQAS